MGLAPALRNCYKNNVHLLLYNAYSSHSRKALKKEASVLKGSGSIERYWILIVHTRLTISKQHLSKGPVGW